MRSPAFRAAQTIARGSICLTFIGLVVEAAWISPCKTLKGTMLLGTTVAPAAVLVSTAVAQMKCGKVSVRLEDWTASSESGVP